MVKFAKDNFFLKFILYYAVLLLIPFSCCIFIFSNTTTILKERIYDSYFSGLKQSVYDMDKTFLDIESTVYNLQHNLSVADFIYSDNPYNEPTSEMSTFLNVQAALTPYKTINDFYNRIFIYSEKSNILVSDSLISLKIDRLYSKNFFIKDMTLTNFIDSFLKKRYVKEYLYNVELTDTRGAHKYMVYADTIKSSPSPNVANIFVFIDENNIFNLLQKSFLSNVTNFHIYAITKDGYMFDQGNLFKSIPIDLSDSASIDHEGYSIHRINNEKIFFMSTISPLNGTRYICALPLTVVAQNTSALALLLLITLVITFVLSILGAILLAYKQSNPIKNIIHLISKKTDCTDISYSYDFINYHVSDLINNNVYLKNEMNTLLPLQKISTLHELLIGEYKNEAEILNMLKGVNIPTDSKLYCVLIVIINNLSPESSNDEVAACKLLINKSMECSTSTNILGLSSIDFEREAIIIGYNTDDIIDFVTDIEKLVHQVSAQIEKDTHLSLSFSGSIGKDVTGISRLYREAKSAATYTVSLNNFKVLWYRKAVNTSNSSFYYTIETELGLINAITEGNLKNLRSIINNIHKYNFVTHQLSKDVLKRLINALLITMSRLQESLVNLSPEITKSINHYTNELINSDYQESFDYLSLFNNLTDSMKELCILSKKEMKNIQNPLIQNVTRYLNENYTDSQLSLSSVATHFGITDIYLSRLFKEQMNQNFSKYVENLRMTKAKELMAQSMKPALVAEKCGYNNVQTFRRVYKQYTTSDT